MVHALGTKLFWFNTAARQAPKYLSSSASVWVHLQSLADIMTKAKTTNRLLAGDWLDSAPRNDKIISSFSSSYNEKKRRRAVADSDLLCLISQQNCRPRAASRRSAVLKNVPLRYAITWKNVNGSFSSENDFINRDHGIRTERMYNLRRVHLALYALK